MWERYRESAGFAVAVLLGVVGGVVYFVATIPEPQDRVSRRGPPPVRWSEWRTEPFHAISAGLDRRDPAAVVRHVFEAHREKNYTLALAYGTDARQRRFTPEMMAARFNASPGLSQWTTLTLGEPVYADTIAAVSLRAEATGSGEYSARAALWRDDPGGWRLEVILQDDPPVRRRGETDGAYAARYVLPPVNIFAQRRVREDPRELSRAAVLMCRADEAGQVNWLFAPEKRGGMSPDAFGWMLDGTHPGLCRAEDAAWLGVEQRGEASLQKYAVTRDGVSRRYTFVCAPVPTGDSLASDASQVAQPDASGASGSPTPLRPQWHVVGIER